MSSCEPSVDAKVEVSAPWHRVADLPEIGERPLSKAEDERYAGRLCASEKAIKRTLVYEPLAWLKCIGVTEPEEVEKVRQTVISRVREREAQYREKRRKANVKVMTVEALQEQPYLKPHVPKKKERKIFVICADKERRLEWLEVFDRIEAQCAACYTQAKLGVSVQWPPGTFVPWLPPTECHHGIKGCA